MRLFTTSSTPSGILALAATVSAICHHGTYLAARSDTPGASYGYDALEGPLNWHSLSEDNSDCALGKHQSPINIHSDTTTSINGTSLSFDVVPHPDGARLVNLGTTVQVYVNGSLALGGAPYELVQFHFHTPSEHRLDSEFYPAEVHFVFQSKNHSSLAVVGIPIEIGCPSDQSPVLATVLSKIGEIPESGDETTTGPLDFSSLEAVVEESIVYQYSGSLTTPPCSEGVAWNVVRDPLFVDYKTFNKLKGLLKFNSRYTQNVPGETNLLENAAMTLGAGHDEI